MALNRYTIKIPYSKERISGSILTRKEIDGARDLCQYLDITLGKYMTMLIKRDLKNRRRKK